VGYCPVCKYEYEDGIVVCATCGEELMDEPPEVEAEYVELVEIARMADPRAAEMLAGELEAAGVPVELADEHGAELFAGAGTVQVRILVPEQWAVEAGAILDALRHKERR